MQRQKTIGQVYRKYATKRPTAASAKLAELVIAPPVNVEGAAVVGPTGVAVGELTAPPFPPAALDATVPLLESLEPEPELEPVGELPVPVPMGFGAGTEPEPDPDPRPEVPLLGWLIYPVPDAIGRTLRTLVDRVLSGQNVVVKVSVTVVPAVV